MAFYIGFGLKTERTVAQGIGETQALKVDGRGFSGGFHGEGSGAVGKE